MLNDHNNGAKLSCLQLCVPWLYESQTVFTHNVRLVSFKSLDESSIEIEGSNQSDKVSWYIACVNARGAHYNQSGPFALRLKSALEDTDYSLLGLVV